MTLGASADWHELAVAYYEGLKFAHRILAEQAEQEHKAKDHISCAPPHTPCDAQCMAAGFASAHAAYLRELINKWPTRFKTEEQA